MNRYYFYKRNRNIREDLKGDLIVFSLSALYGEKAYSQKKRKEVMNFKFFDEIDLSISTKTKGIYQVKYDSGTDGCHGHWATSLQELKEGFVSDQFTLISEKQYLRLRKFALHLIFKNINFFHPVDDDAERSFFLVNKTRRGTKGFYDFNLVSTSQKYNIRNYDQSTLDFYSERDYKLRDLRIDEELRIFVSKDLNYKKNKFAIESAHFNSYYEDMNELKASILIPKSEETKELSEYHFQRLQRFCKALILDRSSFDISNILPKQQHTLTILDI